MFVYFMWLTLTLWLVSSCLCCEMRACNGQTICFENPTLLVLNLTPTNGNKRLPKKTFKYVQTPPMFHMQCLITMFFFLGTQLDRCLRMWFASVPPFLLAKKLGSGKSLWSSWKSCRRLHGNVLGRPWFQISISFSKGFVWLSSVGIGRTTGIELDRTGANPIFVCNGVYRNMHI